jgi:ATP-dependent Clp protease adaptor protein ClpS
LVVTQESQAAVASPEKVEPRRAPKDRPRRQPRYQVILWDDDDHTYEYVIRMMRQLFGHSLERAYELACEVDRTGRVVCLTTTREHAELKRDQIHAFGRDALIAHCQGSMWSTIEAVQ